MPSVPTPDDARDPSARSASGRGVEDDGSTRPRTTRGVSETDRVQRAASEVRDATAAGTSEATPGEPSEGAPAGPPAPAPRSPYAKMSQPTTVRNVVWALSLTMVVVIVVAILFFGVGRDLQREIPENSRVDVTASAERAQDVAPFTVAVPEVDEGWEATGARYQDGEDPRWTIRYSAPSRGLVTMTETTAVTPALVQDLLPGAHSQGTVDVAGTACAVYVGEGEGASRGIACSADGAAILVHGDVEQDELVELATPALEAVRG